MAQRGQVSLHRSRSLKRCRSLWRSRGLRPNGELRANRPLLRWRRAMHALAFASEEMRIVGRRLDERAVLDSSTKGAVVQCLERKTGAPACCQHGDRAAKRPRRSTDQWAVLNAAYVGDPRPGPAEVARIAREAKVSQKQVRTFFQNKRQRTLIGEVEGDIRDARQRGKELEQELEERRQYNCLVERENAALHQSLMLARQEERDLLVMSRNMLLDLEQHGAISDASAEAFELLTSGTGRSWV